MAVRVEATEARMWAYGFCSRVEDEDGARRCAYEYVLSGGIEARDGHRCHPIAPRQTACV